MPLARAYPVSGAGVYPARGRSVAAVTPGSAPNAKRREIQALARAFSTCLMLWVACAAVSATWRIVFS